MLSGAEKTALLLLLLEEPEAAQLLARLEPAEVEAIGRAMLSVAEASPAAIDALLDEVLDIARDTVAVGEGSPTVRDLFGRALGEERAGGMIERLGDDARSPLFERLQWLEPYAIASLLEGEHPQAQALILAQLPGPRAAMVLARLPADCQPDLVRRIATLRPVTPHAAEALDAALAERIATARPRQPLTGLGGMQRAADLINLAGLDEDMALKALSDADPGAAQILSETLFTFADLATLETRGLQNLLRTLDAELLIPALRAAPEELRDKLLAAMPQRAAEALRDEMDNRGPVKVDEAAAAQKGIAAAARRLAAEGTISLPGKGPAYV
ncbi:flagellar motor switch protein FliG [Sandaracinobacter sp. RS1-74]|uniref:flagellar motor switch protein FliG n=1 Tax=Sandaracinobacteroides sayramensis TaxID=2913411 RepID=UPI001EDA3128|nr:FliG C-terminal domain-containing protein [Sandaracinobacteroides sayramensis]MCG2841964.1 flagellar motor switch protein FliG [Sandaracinobacteroides sayramensis]